MNKSKQQCCGCSACQQTCPSGCIQMRQDSEGFLYPHITSKDCISCGKCIQVCPCLHQDGRRFPVNVYAAASPDMALRKASSSGGLFTMLAKRIIESGGAVFGVQFDNAWKAVHGYAETEDGLSRLRGSKYVQSEVNDSFSNVRSMLMDGRPVLFSGTPCQVAGLGKFLGKDYDNLLKVDIACYGVPSPMVWARYLKEVQDNAGGSRITGISFRDKSGGWKDYGMKIWFEDGSLFSRRHSEDPFMNSFLDGTDMRPSCYDCPARCGSSGSDITLGDFWGIGTVDSSLDDDTGTSLVITYTEKGENAIRDTGCALHPESLEEARRFNAGVAASSASGTPHRDFFFLAMRHLGFSQAMGIAYSRNPAIRLIRRIYRTR